MALEKRAKNARAIKKKAYRKPGVWVARALEHELLQGGGAKWRGQRRPGAHVAGGAAAAAQAPRRRAARCHA